MAVEILIPISLFGAVFGVLYVFFLTRNRERLAMIEKGADPKIFASRREGRGVKLGFLAVGVGIGILAGQLLQHVTSMDVEPATFSMILLFGGIGLLVASQVIRKVSKDEA